MSTQIMPPPSSAPANRRPRNGLWREIMPDGIRSFLVYATVVSLALVVSAPLLFSLSAALKNRHQVFAMPPVWIPNPIEWQNFVTAWSVLPFPKFVLNTFVITELCVIGTVLSSSLVAYGFARFNFPGKKILFGLLLATMLLPHQVTMIPVFLIWRELGLINTIAPLTIGSFLGGGAFNIFLLRQFYTTLPRSLDEAAMIDGCSPFGIWWRIMLPLSKASLITVGIFTFTGAWDDFMGPLIYLHDPDKYTVSVGLQLFNDEYGSSDLHLLMAATMIHIVPVVILFLVAQKYFVSGIATSGMKE